jgi:NAD(P)H-quinone oxidoreductase subunit 5
MGFMLLVCGLGVYAAALLHLVAHSFYKAHAFLASGSVIDEARAARVPLPRRLGRPLRLATSLAVAVAVFVPLAALFGVDVGGDPVLFTVGAILVLGTTQLLASALDAPSATAATLRTIGLAAAVTVAFFSLETAAHVLTEAVLPHGTGRSALQLGASWVVLAVFAAVVGLQILGPARRGTGRSALAVHLRNGFYANAVLDRLVGGWRTPTGAGSN